jgi:3-oxoacyl-[acyl-carrier-protein] synthase-1
MNKNCHIIAMDVLNSLGVGTEDVWARVMRKTCGIAPTKRFVRGLYQTDYCAEIPCETADVIRARKNCKVDSRFYLFAYAVTHQVINQLVDLGVDKSKAGLILATTKANIDEFENIVSDPAAKVPGYSNPGVISRVLADELGLTGPVFVVSNACASSLVGIIQAIRLIQRGEAEVMIVVGVDVLSDFLLSGFSSLSSLSSKPCRPYDESRDGLSLGEGAAAIVLCRAECKVPALATVTGWGVSNDANHITGPSRTGEGLKLALSKTLKMAVLQPHQINYINGHGTGTVYNDEMESQALSVIFNKSHPPVSSMKGYFGHTLGAAGVIETVLCIKAIRERTIPASLGFERLGVSKHINVTSEHLNMDLTNIITFKCGFGGVNAALAISFANDG